MDFSFLKKPSLMDKPRTIGQQVYQRPIQSVKSFKSYRANKLKSTDRHRQTDTFAKTIFLGSEGLKTWTFDKNGGGPILHKNTFCNYTNSGQHEGILVSSI